MVNKKGFVHTIEAVIAIVIVLTFIFTALPKETQEQRVPDNIKLIQSKVLYEINSNSSLRENVFNYQLAISNVDLIYLESSNPRKEISSFVTNAINIPTIDYNYTVCDKDNQNCAPDFLRTGSVRELDYNLPNKEVYGKSIMIANATAQRVFRLYLWETF